MIRFCKWPGGSGGLCSPSALNMLILWLFDFAGASAGIYRNEYTELIFVDLFCKAVNF